MSEKGSPTAEAASTAVSDGPADFDLEKLNLYFKECLAQDGTLSMDKYILGYEEIFKFLNLLGTVFGWVASDVQAKIEIIKGHRKNGEVAEHYNTIQDMVNYEVGAKLIKYKARDSSTGSRNLLRLHRALEYIKAFLEKLPGMETADKCCPVSQEAYKKTLMKYHPWVVQKAALVAMHMLPTKEGLILKICDNSEEAYQKALKTLKEAVSAMDAVYDKTQEVYKENGLLELP